MSDADIAVVAADSVALTSAIGIAAVVFFLLVFWCCCSSDDVVLLQLLIAGEGLAWHVARIRMCRMEGYAWRVGRH